MERFFKHGVRKEERSVAYFSMEIGLEEGMRTYSGGLGVLAGDNVKSSADLHVPMVAVTLLHEKGYFRQKLNEKGEQEELPEQWDKTDKLKHMKVNVKIGMEGRKVKVTAWEHNVVGARGYEVPVLFLDTNVEGNAAYDKTLTSHLYGGDEKYRLCQEAVLGIGGVRALNALGFRGIKKYHMNEGHASLLTLELFRELNYTENPKEEVHRRCVFTTHTPVAAGHDEFSLDLVKEVLTEHPLEKEILGDAIKDGKLNMTRLGLHFSEFINGVAKKHGEVSRELFPGYVIEYITNGVHSGTWVSEPFKKLFDRNISGWLQDPFSLRYAMGIPNEEIWEAHVLAKKDLINYVNKEANGEMDEESFTIGFARRATAYKRAQLLFQDVERLNGIAEKQGNIQIIYSGKSHPKDVHGKEIIKKIFELKKNLGKKVRFCYLENYDMSVAKKMVAGCDLWLNTPVRPMEASGTSGMKAAHNGVPSLSVLDGWWIEGCIENVTGWSIGPKGTIPKDQDEEDARDLYNKLEYVIMPLFYNERNRWTEIMKHTIAINASFFNTHRMVSQYVLNAYFA